MNTEDRTGQVDLQLDIRRYLHILRKRWWLIVAAVVVSLAVAGVLTARTPPTYVASTTLFVGQQQVAIEELGQGVALSNLSEDLLASYASIVASRSIAEAAVATSGLQVSPGAVQGSVFAGPIPDTQIIKLSSVHEDPRLAARIANAVAAAFVDEIARIETSGGQGEPAVRVSIIDQALEPGSPIAPNPARNMTLALVLGLLAGVGGAFLFDLLDASVKHREELEESGISVVGVIPKLETEGASVYLERDPQVVGGEAFRKLRTSISFMSVDDPVRTILVSSPLSEEGKTTCALNLASAYAQGGSRTLLVEADLRRPSLHQLFGQEGMRGLTTAIIGQTPLAEAIRNTNVANLSVLLAGAIPPNPVELLDSEQMSDVLARLKERFDMVVIDSPPLIPVADPAALANRVDGVIIVARAGSTHRKRLGEAVKIVEHSGAKLLGVLLNGLSPKDAPGEYEYYYSYRSAERPRQATVERPRS